jgi:hypothetical protein
LCFPLQYEDVTFARLGNERMFQAVGSDPLAECLHTLAERLSAVMGLVVVLATQLWHPPFLGGHLADLPGPSTSVKK